MRNVLRRVLARIRNRRFDDDLGEELRIHEELKRHELEARGLAPDDARAAARRALGNVTLMREDARRVWIAAWLETVVQDGRYAVRSLARQPLHTVTALSVLVLALGLTTTLFTIFKAVALESWPVPDAHEVVRVGAQSGSRRVGFSVDEYRFVREHARSFTGLAAFSANYPARLRADGIPEVSLRATWVSANFFDTLAVPMSIGSGLVASDDTDGGARAPVVLGHVAWRVYFEGDPNVVGRPVLIAGKPFTIVGVAGANFDGNGQDVDLWLPLSVFALLRPNGDLAWDPSIGSAKCCIGVAGRLAPGMSRDAVARELQLLHERYASHVKRAPGRIELIGTAAISGPAAPRFAVFGAFAAAVALILVLACANVGNLQLARGLARRREIATRLSIGASRARLVRQMLTEGMVLALAAGAGSVALAVTTPPVVVRWLDEDIPRYVLARFAPDETTLLFVLAVCTIACLAFALAPALNATRLHIPLGALDRMSTPPARRRLRSLLLATQIAACTVLLAGAGLLTRAIVHAMNYDLGYAIDGVDMVSTRFPTETSWQERTALTKATLQAVTEPAGTPVALAEIPPASSSPLVMHMALPHGSALDYESVLLRPVSSAFFDVLGVPVVRGRMFDATTTTDAVVNEAFARSYWRGEDVIGQTARDVDRKGGIRRTFTIVGVVKDTYLTGLERIDPVIFTPTSNGVFLTRGGPAVTERVRASALSLNPAISVTTEPLRESLRKLLVGSRAGAAMAWVVGLLGLALAAVGVFGVFAYSVEERRREIGLRLALGATGTQIVGLLVATSGRAMVIGLGLGLLLSLACGPLLRRYLFGLHPLDPVAYGGVIVLLAATATIATLVPGRRACRVDPAVTLREE